MIKFNNKYLEFLPDFTDGRTRKFTSIAFTLTALSVFGLFAISPTLSTIAKLKKEIADDEIVNRQLEGKIIALRSLQQAYSRLESDLPIIFEALPISPSVPLFVGQIQSVAKNSNIHLGSLQNAKVDLFGENEASKKYYSYSFSLSGVGLYEDIIKFVETITNMRRIVIFDTLSISKAEKGGSKSLSFSLQGVTYYKK